MNRRHGIYMAVAAVALAGWLWISGIPAQSLIFYAVILACPVTMMLMMRTMNHDHMTQQDTAHAQLDRARIDVSDDRQPRP